MFMNIDEVLSQKPYGVIYCLTCKKNGKVYIGQTTDFHKRIKKYKRLQCKLQIKIYRALKKYGPENFDYDILDMTVNQELLDFLEDFYIETIGSRNHNIGYNIKGGGSHGKHSDETKVKMSKSRKDSPKCRDWKWSTEAKQNNKHNWKGGMIGKSHSIETKEKMSESHKGKLEGKNWKWSEESKKRNKGREKGFKHSEESKKNMSIAQKNSLLAKENIKKLIDNNKGRVLSLETRQKMALAHLGKTLSEEHKKNISKGGKGKSGVKKKK